MILLLNFCKAYTCILQTSSKDYEWWTNIHGAKKCEVEGNWKGGGLLWVDSEVGSWFISTNRK